MRLLALYHDDDGVGKSHMYDGVEDDVLGDGLPGGLEDDLPDYNSGGGLFVLLLEDGQRPDLYDENGDEVLMTFGDSTKL